jgi:broad specificity phosphatase PhoE
VSVARVVLVRHAAPPISWRERVFGRLDVELSPEGREHAERIAGALAAEPIAAVYTSPLRRAADTAAPLARTLGLEPVRIDDLRELDFGELEGLTVAEIRERWPELLGWTAAPADCVFPGGEAVTALVERATRAVRGLAESHPGETVVAFSHAVTIRAILADALAMPVASMFRLDQAHGGISVVEWHDGTPYVRLVNASSIAA